VGSARSLRQASQAASMIASTTLSRVRRRRKTTRLSSGVARAFSAVASNGLPAHCRTFLFGPSVTGWGFSSSAAAAPPGSGRPWLESRRRHVRPSRGPGAPSRRSAPRPIPCGSFFSAFQALLDDLRRTLTSEFEQAGVSGSAEERHVAVKDALDQARKTIAKKRSHRDPV
jgi:hypothetical protein